MEQIVTNLGEQALVSSGVWDLLKEPHESFAMKFNEFFKDQKESKKNPEFWTTNDFPQSHYRNEFEEIKELGEGGFGQVMLCKNKLDQVDYAMKRIPLKDKVDEVKKTLREVATLSRLQHRHVVRYYQAWYETSFDSKVLNEMDSSQGHAPEWLKYLYILMEYCPRSLRAVIDTDGVVGTTRAWDLFAQIMHGLAHIHAEGIMHQDLNPNNIFVDAKGDIKIGDFGLAKLLKQTQEDESLGEGTSLSETLGSDMYMAPEIKQESRTRKFVDEKVDIYSAGVIFFELFCAFGSGRERIETINNLKQSGTFPDGWATGFSKQKSLLYRMLAINSAYRPSAGDILQDLPHEGMNTEHVQRKRSKEGLEQPTFSSLASAGENLLNLFANFETSVGEKFKKMEISMNRIVNVTKLRSLLQKAHSI